MTDTEQTTENEIPPMALFAGTALLLAITLADSKPTERLEKGIKKLVEIADEAEDFSKLVFDHTLSALKEHGIQYYMPGDEPQLEDVLHQMHRSQQEIQSAMQSGTVSQEQGKTFMEQVRQIALAAIFIDADSEPTQEQTEVLNYLYKVAQNAE